MVGLVDRLHPVNRQFADHCEFDPPIEVEFLEDGDSPSEPDLISMGDRPVRSCMGRTPEAAASI